MRISQYIEIFKLVPLFNNIPKAELESMLQCLSAYTKEYQKNEYILQAGDAARTIGIVLYGEVHIMREDVSGNRLILTEVKPSEMFAESFSCARVEELPVSAVATVKSVVLHMDFQRIIKTCGGSCEFHSQLISNMLGILANKNMLLNQKIEYLSKRTTRDKLLAYFTDQAAVSESRSFHIPYKRQELADYLCVDRSAMTSELSRMQKEGLIEFHKNDFRLL